MPVFTGITTKDKYFVQRISLQDTRDKQ